MLIKKKNSFKIIKNKLFEIIKNLVLYLFCFQVIIFLVVFFWYQLSPIKKIHTPEKIINLISSVIFKTTGIEAKRSTNYINSYLKSIYYNLVPPKIPKLYLNLNQKSVIALEFQRQNRANFENLNKEDRSLVEKYVNGSFEKSVDGITLLQEYIDSDPKVITRVEFVRGKFLYAVQVDASDGFELCPADECNIEEKFCPTNPDGNKFMIIKDYKNPEVKKYESLLKSNGIEIAGIEYIKGKDGIHYTYDINTNTNYNSIAERKSNLKGMDSIATFLYNELKK